MRNQFTIEEIIKITGKSKSTIYRDIKKGRLKVKQGEKRGKPVYLITNKELESYNGKPIGNKWEASETPIGNKWEANEKPVGDQNNVITHETLVKAIEEIFSQQETRLIKPLEDQAMFLAGKLTNENQFLKQRLETVLEENNQLREQIKALPGPVESIQQILVENTENLSMLQKGKEELLNRLKEKEKALENYISLSLQLESTSQKLQEKEDEMKSTEALVKKEKGEMEFRLLREKEEALKEQKAKLLQEKAEAEARIKAKTEELEAKLKQEEEEKAMAKAEAEEARKQLKELPAPVESIQTILLDNANNIKALAKEKDKFQSVLKESEATIKEKERALKELDELRRQEVEQLKKQAEEEKAKLKAEAEEEKKKIAEAWKKELEFAKKPWWKFW